MSNRPRNLLITDATCPLTFSFLGQFGIHTSLTVDQTPDEDTWPGGALWDLGLLLAQVLVGIARKGNEVATTLSTPLQEKANCKMKNISRKIQLPRRLCELIRSGRLDVLPGSTILELGCGVGLTGLVAAAALSPKLVVLTDLDMVVEKVARPNVVRNSTERKGSLMRTISKGQAGVVAHTLCWGSDNDEAAVGRVLFEQSCMESAASHLKTRPKKKKGPKQNNHSSSHQPDNQATRLSRSPSIPDVVLIGDVAYQHKPGAPSHFDALLSTLLKFTDHQTLVIFGTRIRMAASVDLLNSLLDHFEEHCTPPLSAEEIDPQFFGMKHNMSIHFLKRKVEQN